MLHESWDGMGYRTTKLVTELSNVFYDALDVQLKYRVFPIPNHASCIMHHASCIMHHASRESQVIIHYNRNTH